MVELGRYKDRNVLLITVVTVLCFGMLFLADTHLVLAADQDFDGVADDVDNCPTVGNPSQFDIDKDGIGIVCDTTEFDQDSDGVADDLDNCPAVANPKQYDLDGDGIGLMCDNVNDQDYDGFTDDVDNCPAVANPKQYDLDGDGIGLVCDNVDDEDNDGIVDSVDNCLVDANPKQYDLDGDGIGLVCDDTTLLVQATVDKFLSIEANAMKTRLKFISIEANAMKTINRYLSAEASTIAARSRALTFERMSVEAIVRNRNLPGPTVGCEGCHLGTVGGNRRPIVGDNGDFTMNSHHVKGTVKSIDCLACHYTGDHTSGIVKLVDPDQSVNVIYEYDPAAPEELEPFCLGCHDSDGALAGMGLTPLSDGVKVPNVKGVAGSMWADSAHANIPFAENGGKPITCLGDGMVGGCHQNAHSSQNYKLLAADAGVAQDQFCFNCHTDGKISNMSLAGGMDDIEEAFSSTVIHDVGTPLNVNGKTFTMQCVSCHNPHVVTGKHWNVDNQVSPLTKPDFTADPATNPYAMGMELWGAVAGQKMDDFASQAAGSGGWYFSVARGGTIIIDQTARYQPTKTGDYPNFEFDGDVLPDYPGFCLECHTHRMDDHPPVNWGQEGVVCDQEILPVSERVTCNPIHGWNRAGRPGNAQSDDLMIYGSGGNPDPIFSEPEVTEGRGFVHYERWPFEATDRNSGVNFVLACTDCHEAHGSVNPSMLRDTINNGPVTPDPDSPWSIDDIRNHYWRRMCNNCHSWQYGQHWPNGPSFCGSLSCHGSDSIHRIKFFNIQSDTSLWQEPSRPTSTPEIVSVASSVGSNEILVTFTEGVYSNADQTGRLEIGDFLLVDKNDDNAKVITGVVHVPGQATATLTLSAVLIGADIGADTLATLGMSIWDSSGEPAGPWPVTLTAP